MRHLAFLAALTGLVASSALTVVACDGRTLDLGYSEPESTIRVITPDQNDEDAPSAAVFTGLVVDDLGCSIVSETVTSSSSGWPAYELAVKARCPGYGRFLLSLRSRADLAYPHYCGTATEIYAGVESETDGEVLAWTGGGEVYSFWADGTKGSCTSETGPTAQTPNASITLVATIADADGRTHRVRYGKGRDDAGTGLPIITDSGSLPDDAPYIYDAGDNPSYEPIDASWDGDGG